MHNPTPVSYMIMILDSENSCTVSEARIWNCEAPHMHGGMVGK